MLQPGWLPARQSLRDSAWLPQAEAGEGGALPEAHTASPFVNAAVSLPRSLLVYFSLSPEAVSPVTKRERGRGIVSLQRVKAQGPQAVMAERRAGQLGCRPWCCEEPGPGVRTRTGPPWQACCPRGVGWVATGRASVPAGSGGCQGSGDCPGGALISTSPCSHPSCSACHAEWR